MPNSTNATRQARFRDKNKSTQQAMSNLIEAITHALDDGHSGKLADNLPEEEEARIKELTTRLQGVKLVAFKKEERK